MNLDPFKPRLEAFGSWLAQQNSSAAEKWKERLELDLEGAVGEALTWDFLNRSVDQIRHNEHPKTGGLDFACRSGHSEFLTECTAIQTETATKKTDLSPDLSAAGGAYRSPFQAVADKINDKASQLRATSAPVLLAICTLHLEAGAVGIRPIFVEQMMSLFYNTDPAKGLSPARANMSAVLLLGFGWEETPALGMIHPAPACDFRPVWMPTVDFCTIKDWPAKGDHFEWFRGNPPQRIDPT